MGSKTLLLGIDGARLDVIKKWVKEGDMSFFRKILEDGSSGNLETVFPPHSMLAWTSLQTGKNPGKHGVYNTVLKKRDSYRHYVPNANDIKGATMFDYLTEKYDCCSVNLPMTYPPRNREMITVSAWLAPPLSSYARPEEVQEEFRVWATRYSRTTLIRKIQIIFQGKSATQRTKDLKPLNFSSKSTTQIFSRWS